ncbi:MAG: hypothetical protein FWF86_09390, partial [Clostridia bacterium]|nr:hypothetical protein [Clostridia bacterium]
MNCEKKDCLLQRKPGSLLPGDWLPRLQTRWAGRGQVRYASAMDSTNRVLADMARQGAAAGSMAICEVQRQGRGRLNRRWDSPEGEGLLQSLLLHPRLPAERAQLCTLAAAVAMAQAIEDAAPGLGAGIK